MIKREFLIIGITLPDFYPDEAKRINELLYNNEADLIHIRKPYANEEEIENLLNKVDPSLHNRLKLHDHFELLEKYNLGGVHLNSRNNSPHPKARSISKSLHSLSEIKKDCNYDYFFISPVFDSISKIGYKAAFDLNDISRFIKDTKAVALGGITKEKLPLLKSLGFYGAAMTGYFFQKNNLTEI